MRLFKPKQRIVATIGYPGHGKTVFLAGLFWDSFFALSGTLQDGRRPYAVRAVNEEASHVFYGNAITLSNQGLPPPNPRDRPPQPAILEFTGVPRAHKGRWRKRIRLTFYDLAGESVTSDDWLRRNAPFLPRAHDIIFLFDPTHPDFSGSALRAAELLDRLYRVAPKSKRRNFIVALSKMDELRAQDDWAEEIDDLWPDDPPSPSDLPHYLHEMDNLSDALPVWWRDQRQAHNFISSLPKTTRFCALSSLGHPPVWDCPGCNTANPNTLRRCGQCHAARGDARLRLTRKPEPFRVRDPLFWIFRAAGVM
jgi:hypothetical protein